MHQDPEEDAEYKEAPRNWNPPAPPGMESVTPGPKNLPPEAQNWRPIGFLLLFIPTFFALLTNGTNSYMLGRGSGVQAMLPVKLSGMSVSKVEEHEMWKFFAIIGMSALTRLPAMTDYWKPPSHEALGRPYFGNIMSHRRYKEIKHFLHLRDNDYAVPRDNDTYDPMWKIRPFITEVSRTFGLYWELAATASFDEIMCGFKGRNPFRRVIPGNLLD